MKAFWFIIIVIGALLIGISLEYYGRECEACQGRKKKIIDFFGKKNNNPTEVPSVPKVGDGSQISKETVLKMI